MPLKCSAQEKERELRDIKFNRRSVLLACHISNGENGNLIGHLSKSWRWWRRWQWERCWEMQKAKTEEGEEKEEMNGHGKSQSLLLLLLHRAPHYIQWKSTKNRPHRLGPGTQTLPLTLHSKGHGPIRQCGQWHTLKHRHKYSLSVFRGKEDSSIINTAAAASASTLLANTHTAENGCVKH